MTTPSHQDRTAMLEQLLIVRHALEQAGLCGPDNDPDNDGREAAFAVMQSLTEQRVILYPLPDPEPPQVPAPTLGERLVRGTMTLGTHLTSAAATHRPAWTRRAKRSRP